MNIKPLMLAASLGIVVSIVSAVVYNMRSPAQPPIAVTYNPYENGVYATGIVESFQPTGSNVNIYAEVSSRVIHVFVKNGDQLKKNDPILEIDSSPQQGIIERDLAQIEFSQASLKNVKDQLTKIQKAYDINPKSISQNSIDNALNAVDIAKATLQVALQQYKSDLSIFKKYLVKSPIDGVVLRIVPAVGDYISPQGSYDSYTQGFLPSVQMGVITPYLQVRSYIDEILVPNLPVPSKLEATMFIRGLNNKSYPLEFMSIQPFTIPNIQLSDQKNERVDVRVLPIIFKFKKPKDINIFPGQLVDVYLKGKA